MAERRHSASGAESLLTEMCVGVGGRVHEAELLLSDGAVSVVPAPFEEPVFDHALRQHEKGDEKDGYQHCPSHAIKPIRTMKPVGFVWLPPR
jgi:hypothetical protein